MDYNLKMKKTLSNAKNGTFHSTDSCVENLIRWKCILENLVLTQSSVLEPLPFIIFSNGLQLKLSSKCTLFAGNVIIYNMIENSLIIQTDLNKLYM